MKAHAHPFLLPFCLAATWLVWGSTYLGIKFALLSFTPYVLSGVRYLVAGFVLLAIVKFQRAPWPNLRQTLNAGIIGILMTTIGNGLTCVAERTMPSGATALIIASTPLMTVVLGHLLGTRARTLEWYGIVLGIVGIVLINLDAELAADPRGVALVMAACLSWALASVLIPRLDLPEGAMSSAVQMVVGGFTSIPIALAMGDRIPSHVEPKAVLALAYLIVFGSIIAYSSYVWLLRNARPALASSCSYVNPVVALFLGWLVGGEAVSWPLVAGIAIILTGVVLISRASHHSQAPEPEAATD